MHCHRSNAWHYISNHTGHQTCETDQAVTWIYWRWNQGIRGWVWCNLYLIIVSLLSLGIRLIVMWIIRLIIYSLSNRVAVEVIVVIV